MSNVLVVGGGPLAHEMADLIELSDHTVVRYVWGQQGRETAPLQHLPDFVREIADRIDLVIEAIVGDRRRKREVLSDLNNAFLGMSEPILTATLNASATEVASWVIQPENIIGWAALPPLANSKVFEVMSAAQTAPETIKAATEFLSSLGKQPVMIEDTVGGILPRIVANLINEAAFALGEQVATAKDIDQAMKLGTNYPHGPLEWADIIGLDQVVGIINALGEVYGNDKYHPAPILRQLALAGYWGKRAGRGFYTYNS
jgi:3-hydroxybutyryl-CoA dehydrogenase